MRFKNCYEKLIKLYDFCNFASCIHLAKVMNKIVRSIIVVVIAVFAYTVSYAQEELKGAELKKYKTALSYAHGTNNKMAIKLFKELYEKHPNDINIVYNLGLCYMNMSGNPDSALYYLQKVDEMDTEGWSDARSELHLAIGRSYQLGYKFDEALKVYDEIEKNDPEKVWADMLKRERDICRNAQVLMKSPVKLQVRDIAGDINTPFNDYRPVVSFDQKTMFFTSRRGKGQVSDFEDGQFEEAIYISKNVDDSWEKPTPVENLFDESGLQEAATCLSQGSELYIVRNGDLYVSKLDTVSDEWSMAEKLPDGINSKYEENYVCVTEDGQEMYFSSNRPGGYGGFDIYHCYKLPNGEWGVPTNLGESVNTEYDEDCPIVHPTKPILYFSSNGHNTMGGFDIFFAPINPADSTISAVMNIGYPINTPDDDLYFVPTAEKNMAYYSSIKWSKGLTSGFDIYEVEYDEPEVDKMAVISSKVLSSDVAAFRVYATQNGETVGRFVPHKVTGKFVIIVEAGGEYTITVTDGNTSVERNVTTTECNSYNKSGKEVEVEPFDFRKAEVEAQALASAEAAKEVEDDASSAQEGATVVAQVDDDKVYYTVQFMSLRRSCPMEKIDNLDTDKVLEFVYKDGWYVYSYGKYDSIKEANEMKRKIIESTYYDDSFVRNIKNYKKFLK